MNGKGMFRASTLALGLLGCWAVAAQAAPPWGGLLALNHGDTDAKKDYPLTESQGPWMIMAHRFSGDDAKDQAKALTLELRSRYKLEAFVHKVEFDFGAAPSRSLDKYGQPRKAVYNRNKGAEKVEEYAVLVGSFQTADEPAAQQMLKKVKLAAPKCLGSTGDNGQSVADWQKLQREALEQNGVRGQPRGPMGQAFVTTNPVLPPDYFNAKGLDEFVIGLNSDKDMKWSLLECRGKYTVQVAQFKGAVIIDQKKIKEIGKEKDFKSQLSDAGDRAERLTEALRIKGYEAYTFHDRYASIVTVGSFDSVGIPRADGKMEINPKVLAVMQTFAGHDVNKPTAIGDMVPKSLAGIPFDIQPVPVQVPRRSMGANYGRSMLGLR